MFKVRIDRPYFATEEEVLPLSLYGSQVEIVFKTKEEKEKYLKQEYAYTNSELRALWYSCSQNARMEAKLNLYARRLKFATINGHL